MWLRFRVAGSGKENMTKGCVAPTFFTHQQAKQSLAHFAATTADKLQLWDRDPQPSGDAVTEVYAKVAGECD